MFQELWFASFRQLIFLYLVVFSTFVYLLMRYGKSSFYLLIILFFYPAIFAFMGKNVQDGYKVFILLLTLWISLKRQVFALFQNEDYNISIFFFLFSLCYGYSVFSNGDNWTIILSQYSRYVIAYCIWFLLKQEFSRNHENLKYLVRLTYDLVLMQIVITVAKFFIFEGRQIESLVGSISHIGGATGTIIPILGFIVLWMYRSGVLIKKDWFFIAGLFLIGFLSGKRAVWFILPVVFAAFMIYIPNLKLKNSFWLGVIFISLAFYIGFKLTPTLNPENKVWGSFNLSHAINYAQNYQFGDEKLRTKNQAQGRGGATLLVWSKWNSGGQDTFHDWFGQGLSEMYSTNYEEFLESNSEISHKGSATGLYQTYITTGYSGIITTLLFFFSMSWCIKVKRIRLVIIFLLAWEYFMYTGLIFRSPPFMFLIIYFIHYSNFKSYAFRSKLFKSEELLPCQ